MSENQSTALVLADTALATSLGLSEERLIATIKRQCFKTDPDRISKEQLVAYVQVASAIREQAPKFNPLLPGMLFAFPTQSGGIEPMIGPDGIFAILASSPVIVGGSDGSPAWWCEHGKDADGNAICTAHIRHRDKGVISKTIWVSEWIVQRNPNWATRPRHMSEIRALKQCARQIIHGIPMDEDEIALAERGIGFENAKPVGDAPAQEAADRRPVTRPQRKSGVVAAVAPQPEAPPQDDDPPIDISSATTATQPEGAAPKQETAATVQGAPSPATVEVKAEPIPQSAVASASPAPVGGKQETAAPQGVGTTADRGKPAADLSKDTEVVGTVRAYKPGKRKMPDNTFQPIGIFEIATAVYEGKAFTTLNRDDPMFHKGLARTKPGSEEDLSEAGETPPLMLTIQQRGDKVWITKVAPVLSKPKPAEEEV